MQSTGMSLGAVVLATASLVALITHWQGHAVNVRPAAHVATPPPALRTLAPVEKASHDQLTRQLAELSAGNVVLDMRALESLDAAITLVEHWRDTHPVEAHLVCWLAAAEDADLVTAVRFLSETGCSALRVALVEVTASSD